MLKKGRKVLVVVGPTAVGKSALAVKLARKYNGEVVSADSRQVYRGFNIGTGKITRKEMRGIRHHLLDIANPSRQYSVARYVKDARKATKEIVARGKLPIICGGTGLYIDALFGKFSIPDVPPNMTLRKKLEKKSAPKLLHLLAKLDPDRAMTIEQQNPRRLIRAIEIAKAIGRVPKRGESHVPLEVLWLGITLPREELKKRISERLEARIRKGMIAEAKILHKGGPSWRRMEELGLEYRYLSRYLRGLITREQMKEKLRTEIWRYAKRQMTWFKRDTRIRWFAPKEFQKIVRKVENFLKE